MWALPISSTTSTRCTDGAIHRGERIPSVRDMAELMQVAPNTVVHAYDKLALRGLVYPCALGYYISEGAVETIRAEKRRAFHEESIPRFRRDAELPRHHQRRASQGTRSLSPPTPLLSACPRIPFPSGLGMRGTAHYRGKEQRVYTSAIDRCTATYV